MVNVMNIEEGRIDVKTSKKMGEKRKMQKISKMNETETNDQNQSRCTREEEVERKGTRSDMENCQIDNNERCKK